MTSHVARRFVQKRLDRGLRTWVTWMPSTGTTSRSSLRKRFAAVLLVSAVSLAVYLSLRSDDASVHLVEDVLHGADGDVFEGRAGASCRLRSINLADHEYRNQNVSGFDASPYAKGSALNLHAAIAVLPAEAVLPGSIVTVFGSWPYRSSQLEGEEKLKSCIYHCLFDFGRKSPTMAQKSLPTSPWTETKGSTHVFYDLVDPNDAAVVSTASNWAANTGFILKCPVPLPPTGFRVDEVFAPVLVTVHSLCKNKTAIAPSSAVMTVDIHHQCSTEDPTKKSAMAQRAYRQFSRSGSNSFLCVCSMISNDAPRIREWIEYHKLIGFEHFIFYDNNSSDHLLSTLRPYLEQGIVHMVNWHFRASETSFGPQSQAFSHCLEKFGGRGMYDADLDMTGHVRMKLDALHHRRSMEQRLPQCEWISFHDVDEFLVVDPFKVTGPPSSNLTKKLEETSCRDVDPSTAACRSGKPGNPSAYIPRIEFGHSDLLSPPSGLRIREFTRRGELPIIGKSIAQRRTLPSLQNSIHYFLFPPALPNFPSQPGTAFRTGMHFLSSGNKFGPDATTDGIPCDFLIFHYGTMSWVEYVEKWGTKPRAHGLCNLNRTFIAEVEGEIQAGSRQRWPTTQDLVAHNFFGRCHPREIDKGHELETFNEIGSPTGISRYFGAVEGALAAVNRDYPIE